MHFAVTPKDLSHSRHITYSSSVQFLFPLIPNTFYIYSKAIFSSIRDLKDWIGLMWAGLVHSSLPHLRACCICVNALSAITPTLTPIQEQRDRMNFRKQERKLTELLSLLTKSLGFRTTESKYLWMLCVRLSRNIWGSYTQTAAKSHPFSIGVKSEQGIFMKIKANGLLI